MASSLDTGNDVGKELECPICLETFTSPKLLSCMHSFCAKCLTALVKFGERDERKIQCPTCRHETMIIKDVNSLHTNFIVQNVIEKLKVTILRDDGKLKCDECHKDFAHYHCSDCMLHLCSVCSDFLHKRSVRYAGHKVVDIKEVTQDNLVVPALKYCDKHQEVLKYYCEMCKLIVCHDCTISKAHSGHSVSLVDEVAEEKRQELKAIVDDAATKQERYQQYIKEAESFLESAKVAEKTSVEVVKATFDAIVSDMTVKKQSVINKIIANGKDASGKIEDSKDKAKVLENILQFAQSIIINGGNEEIMEIFSDLKMQFQDSITKIDTGKVTLGPKTEHKKRWKKKARNRYDSDDSGNEKQYYLTYSGLIMPKETWDDVPKAFQEENLPNSGGVIHLNSQYITVDKNNINQALQLFLDSCEIDTNNYRAGRRRFFNVVEKPF